MSSLIGLYRFDKFKTLEKEKLRQIIIKGTNIVANIQGLELKELKELETLAEEDDGLASEVQDKIIILEKEIKNPENLPRPMIIN